MNQGIISSRYAKALLLFSIENKEEQQVFDEMCAFVEAYLNVSSLRIMLANPVVSISQKKSLILAASTAQKSVSKSIERFLELVIDKKREEFMLFIAQAYIDIYRKRLENIDATLTLALPLSKDFLNKLEGELRKKIEKDFELTIRYDTSLIGGFIFECDNMQLDASIKTQLSRIQHSL